MQIILICKINSRLRSPPEIKSIKPKQQTLMDIKERTWNKFGNWRRIFIAIQRLHGQVQLFLRCPTTCHPWHHAISAFTTSL
ncbi:MAG: hypothetical protein GQ532_18655 [Methylomarinum sp.]|nr:hypothetical protein [Methylomarinum sp.]